MDWILVKQQLPTLDEMVLVYSMADETIGFGYFHKWRNKRGWECFATFNPDVEGLTDSTITHWMPLPAPPLREEGEGK